MRRNKLSLWTLLAAALLMLSASLASAADSKRPAGPAPAGTALEKGAKAPEAYGIDAITRISLLSYAFQGNDPYNDQISDDGQSYRAFTSATSEIFSASVSIPAGAAIVGIGFDNCDNTSGTMTMYLVDRFGDHASTGVASVNSSDASFCGFNSFTLATPYNVDSNIDHVFELYTLQDMIDPTLKFRSAFVDYKRRISPAPGAPSFGDVPLSDPGFQYIEALVASGITGGCGGGNYCPDNPLTRRQMAIFLAKGLGLHWAY